MTKNDRQAPLFLTGELTTSARESNFLPLFFFFFFALVTTSIRLGRFWEIRFLNRLVTGMRNSSWLDNASSGWLFPLLGNSSILFSRGHIFWWSRDRIPNGDCFCVVSWHIFLVFFGLSNFDPLTLVDIRGRRFRSRLKERSRGEKQQTNSPLVDKPLLHFLMEWVWHL